MDVFSEFSDCRGMVWDQGLAFPPKPQAVLTPWVGPGHTVKLSKLLEQKADKAGLCSRLQLSLPHPLLTPTTWSETAALVSGLRVPAIWGV